MARSLFLYGLTNRWITEGTTVIESSSGSTSVSEAYFARLLGLPFVAVMPRKTTNVWELLQKANLMKSAGREGSIVTLICDSEERYLDTYYNTQWIEANFGELAEYEEKLKKLVEAT